MIALGRFAPSANPVLQRECLTLLRSRKAYLLLAAYVICSAGVVLAAWPGAAARAVGGLTQGEVARELLSFFHLAQSLLVAVIMPAILAPSFAGEKERATFDLVLTTPLTGVQLVLGKVLTAYAFLLLLLVASLPVVLLGHVLGGLSAGDVLGMYAHLAAQACVYGRLWPHQRAAVALPAPHPHHAGRVVRGGRPCRDRRPTGLRRRL